MKNQGLYYSLEAQLDKIARHNRQGSYRTKERYYMAMKRFCHFLADEYHLQKLSNISEKHILSYLEYMQKKGLAASTVKTELAAIRFFHDNMPYTRNELPSNKRLQLAKRSFGGVDRTWTNGEFNIIVGIAIENHHNDFASIMTLARYAGLRLEECFRIDTNDARKALEEGRLYVKGKGGLTRYVPINESIRVVLRNTLKTTPVGQKLFVRPSDKTHLAMKRLQCFIAYHRKSFTDRRITFHGLRHTYAHEQYDKFIQQGYSDYKARKLVSELLGHHRDDVTRIYLYGGDENV